MINKDIRFREYYLRFRLKVEGLSLSALGAWVFCLSSRPSVDRIQGSGFRVWSSGLPLGTGRRSMGFVNGFRV